MNKTSTEHLIDVRSMPPRERHPKIFGTWKELAPGESILLVNDHDPVPLYYQFAAEHVGTFRWDYLEQGPQVYRVRISKGDFADPGFKPGANSAQPCSTASFQPIEFVKPLVLDTRPILARGDSPCPALDEALARLIPGQPLTLIAPFEPIPLYAKLGQLGFTHHSRQIDALTWQAEFRRK